MKRSTKRKILIMTLKSIRVVAWVVCYVLVLLGLVLVIAEADESVGAGAKFSALMFQKTLVSFGMFGVGGLSGVLAQNITTLFDKCGVK